MISQIKSFYLAAQLQIEKCFTSDRCIGGRTRRRGVKTYKKTESPHPNQTKTAFRSPSLESLPEKKGK